MHCTMQEILFEPRHHAIGPKMGQNTVPMQFAMQKICTVRTACAQLLFVILDLQVVLVPPPPMSIPPPPCPSPPPRGEPSLGP